MAWELISVGRKYHGPRHVRRPPPQLAVHEIGDPAEEEADRPGRAGDVADRQERDAALVREQHHGEHAAEEAAVERHAAVPYLQHLDRVLAKELEIVEQ